MPFKDMTDYQAHHSFSILSELGDAAIEDAFTTSLVQNDEAIRQELEGAVVKAVGDKIMDRQATPPITE